MCGLVFLNLVFFMLLSIGGASMAVVEGVAGSSWLETLFITWLVFHIPWLFYGFVTAAGKSDPEKLASAEKCRQKTAWLAFPGAIAVFFLIGSNRLHYAIIFPMLQLSAALIIYSSSRRKNSRQLPE